MRVVFVTALLTQYRIPFHERVRHQLAESGIQYDVIFGQPSASEGSKGDLRGLSWGTEIKNQYIQLGPYSMVWQPAFGKILQSNLAILGQENRFLLNYLAQATRSLYDTKIALWGHGRNFQADAGGFSQKWKQLWATRCDWWFAYTAQTQIILKNYGFPSERITSIENAIDTSGLQAYARNISTEDLQKSRMKFGIKSDQVGIYVGGIYDHKRSDFLISAAVEIRKQIPDFTLIVVGGGPDSRIIDAASTKYSWIRYLGPRFGREKTELMLLAKVFLMPGLVGLAVLDCAALGLPIVTTAYPYHSPEFAYLKPGKNGIIVHAWDDVTAYADAVVALLRDSECQRQLRLGALEIGEYYTIDRMAGNFCMGVKSALASAKR